MASEISKIFKMSKNTFAIVTIFIFLMSFANTEARRYYPENTKERAIQMIRANSEEVCRIADLEPISKDSVDLEDMLNESELLSDNLEPAEIEIQNQSEELDKVEYAKFNEDYNDVSINEDNFNSQWLKFVSDGDEDIYTESGVRKQDLMKTIMAWLGTPYRFGGTSTKAIDCSAFTRAIYLETAKTKIPRTARWQFEEVGEKIENPTDLQFGDLIFFHTRSYAYASHCGIYLGDNLFAHASSRYGVTVSSLESNYYSKRFIGGRRIQYEDIKQFSIHKDEEQEENINYGG